MEVLIKPSGLGPLLERYRPDLVLVCGWYWKIPAETLAKVAGGFIGLHASLLPRYRGFAPLVWSLLNGEPEAGLSLFYLEDGLDTGDILVQKKFPLGPDATIAEALGLAESHSLTAIREVLPLLLAGRAPRTAQDHARASFCSQRKPEDGLIDWKASGLSIHNAVRAQTHPYPGAFTVWEGRKLYLWKSGRFAGDYFGIPGLTVESRAGEAVVACGQGAVRLLEAQLEGEAPRPAGEILKYGARLG
jgi:methionyl-tRNA formyltransferase